MSHPIFSLVLCLYRLHREALKQSATDPKTGLIDINILTTGLSITDRKRRLELAKALRTLLQEKGKVASVKYQAIYEEIRELSDAVSTVTSLPHIQNSTTLYSF